MKTIDIANEQGIKPINRSSSFLNVEYIYIPVKNKMFLQVKNNEYIYKGSCIYNEANNIIKSPISGFIKGFVTIGNLDYLVVKNDFKELSIMTGRARNFEKFQKEDFIKLLNNENLIHIFSGYIDTLYINFIDDEPYFFNKYIFLKEELSDVQKLAKCISNLFNIKNINFVIKNCYLDFMNNNNDIVTNTGKISFMSIPNIYPIGNDDLLKKYLIHNDSSKLMSYNDFLYLLYIIKKNTDLSEKYITIYGNAMTEGYTIKVKKYTYLNDVFRRLNLNFGDVDFILNNSLCGQSINPNEIIINEEFNGVIVNKKTVDISLSCNKCGMCYEVCPIKINPLLMSSKCLKCGLCNYVCPAKINVIERYQKNE